MRYLGNKTKLIPFLLGAVEEAQETPGVACDPFAGTASVGAALKRGGWQVHCGDLMAASYALQVARVALDGPPSYPPPPDSDGDPTPLSYGDMLERLADAEERGFISEHYTRPGDGDGDHGRMYFSEENGRRIDGIRAAIDAIARRPEAEHAAIQFLLATLIEAADRVANTTGVYASYVKSLQPNARRPLALRAVETTPAAGGQPSTAFRGPAQTLLESVGTIDLVYLDPPYNGRQYPGYYHIPELIALGWSQPPAIRGKTGLIPDEDLRSDWCRKGRALEALRDVLSVSDGRHLLFSYNDEGLLPRETIETELRQHGVADSYRFWDQPYRRYRSDSDGPDRTYHRDDVKEHLHYVRCR